MTQPDDERSLVRIVLAAREYVAARRRLEDSAGADTLARAVELDERWHELSLACGQHDPECECELVELEYRTGRRVRTEKGL